MGGHRQPDAAIDQLDVTTRALAESEARYRMIADRTTDVVIETDADWRITWISPSIKPVLGFDPVEVIGLFALDVAAPEELVKMLEFRDRVMTSTEAVSTECRLMTADDGQRWVSLHAQATRHPNGQVRGIIGGFRDSQTEVVFRRAAMTLSAANAMLVRATDELELLTSMCDAAVAKGGYRSSWYGRSRGATSVRFVAQSGIVGEQIQQLAAHFGSDLLGSGPTGQVARSGVTKVLGSPRHHPEYQPWGSVMAELGVESAITVPVFVDGVLDGAMSVCAAESDAFDADAVQVMEDLASQVGAGLSRLRALERLNKALQDQALFMTAIDQAGEGIVITDPAANIIYVNPAALQSSGYTAEEVIGHTPRVFRSGVHDQGFYEAMWSKLTNGESFHGVLMNRRKDGTLHPEETTITPVRDADGLLQAFVAVRHDLAQLRELEHAVTQQRDDRRVLVDIMRDVRSSDTLEATAGELCKAATQLDGIDGAIVLFAHPSGQILPLGMLTDAEQSEVLRVGQAIPMVDSGALMVVSAAGPWWADLNDPTGPAGLFPEVCDFMVSQGFTATGYVPIRWEGEMVGVLSIATKSPDAREWMPIRLSVIEELGTFTGMLLGESVMRLGEKERERAVVRSIIDGSQFHPVFQPVVDATSGVVVGYEALTRFDDGMRPDLRFAIAHDAGLGSELESVCAAAALGEAHVLPSDAWLSINFSPAALTDGTAAATIGGATRQIVV
ncbi:MAG: PAS domain S-box protein, partial [Ilumatobacteraceae bacterium]